MIPDQSGKIQAGDFNQQIVIQQGKVPSSPDTRGHKNLVWPNLVTGQSGNQLTVAGAAFVLGQAVLLVVFNGSPPAPLVAGATYYVQSVASGGSVVTLAATLGGAVIPLTNQYTGTAYLFGGVASGLTVRCRIDKLNGRKGELARQYMPTATHMVQMRYRDGIDETTTRLVFKQGRIYNIGVVDDVDKMHVRLELTCEELRSKGAA